MSIQLWLGSNDSKLLLHAAKLMEICCQLLSTGGDRLLPAPMGVQGGKVPVCLIARTPQTLDTQAQLQQSCMGDRPSCSQT